MQCKGKEGENPPSTHREPTKRHRIEVLCGTILVAVETLRRNALLLISTGLHGLCCLLLLLSLLLHMDVTEPRVLQGFGSTDAQLWAKLQHALEEIDAGVVDSMKDAAEILGGVHLESGLVLRELRDPRPGALSRGAHDAEDADDLVLIGGAREERTTGVHLCHDAAGRPDVDACVIGPASEKDIWRTVPECDDLVREGVDRDAECTGETEVAKLQQTFTVDEQVLGLEVAVENTVLMAEVDSLEKLVHEALDCSGLEGTTFAISVHVPLKIAIHVLEHQHELVLSVDDVVEGDDVFVLELFHERDFTDSCGGCALFGIEVYFLQSDELAGLAIAAFEYRSISSLTQLLQLLERTRMTLAVHGEAG